MKRKGVALVGLIVAFTIASAASYVLLTSPSYDNTTLTYRLKWLANTGFVGDLYADNYGLYTEEGLEVLVEPGGPENNPIRGLGTGRVEFGVASSDQVIRALAKADTANGNQRKLVVIAQIYHQNPVRWIHRSPSVMVDDSSDLEQYSIGVTAGDTDETIFRALENKYKLNLSTREVSYSYAPFFNESVDLFPVYLNTQGVEIKRQMASSGIKTAFFNPTDYGVNIASNSIVTTARKIREEPDTVRAFLRATLKGWREALDKENLEKSINVMASHTDFDKSKADSVRSILRRKIQYTRKLVVPADEESIGTIDTTAWKQAEKIMLKQGLIRRRVGIVDHINSSYLPR